MAQASRVTYDHTRLFFRGHAKTGDREGMIGNGTVIVLGSGKSGTDAVLVAGSGLIIRRRKSIVGSNPTRPTKYLICDSGNAEGIRKHYS